MSRRMIVAHSDTATWTTEGEEPTGKSTDWVITVVEDGEARTFVAQVGSPTWLDLQALALSSPTLAVLAGLS